MVLFLKKGTIKQKKTTKFHFLGMPLYKNDFIFPNKELEIPKIEKSNSIHRKIKKIYLFDQEIIITKHRKLLNLSKEQKIQFEKKIQKVTKWGDELICVTKQNFIYFLGEKFYYKKFKSFIDISVYEDKLYILTKHKLIEYGDKRKSYKLKDIYPTKFIALPERKILIVEKSQIYLIDLNTKVTKHILGDRNLFKIIKIEFSFLLHEFFTDVNEKLDEFLGIKDFHLENTNKKIYKEEVVYCLTLNLIIYINLSTLEHKIIDFGKLKLPNLSVNEKYVVIHCTNKVIIFNKTLTKYNVINGYYDSFNAIKGGFVYIIDNDVFFTEGTGRKNLKCEKLKTSYQHYENSFFSRDNFYKLKSKFNYDCLDSESYNDEYGSLLEGKVTDVPEISENERAKVLKHQQWNSKFNYKRIKKSENMKISKENNRKIEKLMNDLVKYEDYVFSIANSDIPNHKVKDLVKDNIGKMKFNLYDNVSFEYNKLLYDEDNAGIKLENNTKITQEKKPKKKGF